MTLQQKIKINGLKSGLFLGLIITALAIFYFYYITAIVRAPVLLVAGPVFFYLFIPVFVIVFLCFDARKKIGGFWTFKEATTGIFIMFFVAYLVYSLIINLIFYKYIEPDYLHKTQTAVVNARTAFLKQRGYDQKIIDKNLSDMKKGLNQQNKVTIASTFQWIVIYTLFIFIFALIFGSLFKKERTVPAS